jgi:hypothetical protein
MRTHIRSLAVGAMTFGSELRGLRRLPAEAIAQLRPFVGRWDVEQVLRRPGGRADTTYLESVIEFSADSSTLIVRESTRDGRFHFVVYRCAGRGRAGAGAADPPPPRCSAAPTVRDPGR